LITTCHSENTNKPTKKAKNNAAISGLIAGWDSEYKASTKAHKKK
jgi:hypothetical protein